MNLTKYNLYFKLLLVIYFILHSKQLSALHSDNKQPIYINAAQQIVDLSINTITLTGNVVVKRGSIDIHADKIIILRDGNKEIVEGYGNPVTFYQLQDNDKPVNGYALKIRYETDNDLLVLAGNAYLAYLNNNVTADRINYLIKKQQMEALSKNGTQVTTVLLPSQLQHNMIKTSTK